MDRNMNTTPNRRLHEDSVNGSGNHSHPSVLKFPHDDQGIYSAVTGKVVSSSRHDYHAPYDVGPENRIPKIVQRNELRDAADRRSSPLLPNMLFRVPTPNDSRSDHVGTETRMEFRDPSVKEIKVDSREVNKDSKHERDVYSEHKGNEKTDKDCNGVSNISQFNWKDMKEQQHRVKQYPEVVPGVNADTWHMSRTCLHGPTDAAKGSLHVVDNRNITEAVGENKVDMKGDDKFKDKDRKRKEVKLWEKEVEHWDWGELNKEVVKEERESSERWGNDKKEKEKMNEKEKDHVKRELWSSTTTDKEVFLHDEKDVVLDVHGKSVVEQESSALEVKKKDPDTWKNNIDREARDKKKVRDADVESERPDKRSRYHEKESDEGGMLVEGGAEREREVFGCGVQQRKRMLRPRSSPQMGNSTRHRAGANDNEGSHGKGELSCVNYKIGESMQELVRLWKEYEVLQADKACEGSQDGPTLEIRIPAEYVTATNRQVRGGQLWGTDVYTVDSDLVAVLMHTGYCRPTASPPPPATQELRATIRVLPPQDCYISALRNNVRSRAWGAAIGCSYRVERCYIVKKVGGIIDLEPCLTHSSTMEPTLAPVAAERTMTTRAAASNALRQQRFVREVTIQFNLCMEPWLKYSISAVADKGLKKSLFTSARLKKGEVLYVETHTRRYELCFNGEKVIKAALLPPPHAHGVENGRTQNNNPNLLCNGEKHTGDGDNSTVTDVFRWSRCKRHIPQKIMQSIGIPLPLEHVEVLEDNLEWDDISWSQTGTWIGGKEYHLARVHFLSPN